MFETFLTGVALGPANKKLSGARPLNGKVMEIPLLLSLIYILGFMFAITKMSTKTKTRMRLIPNQSIQSRPDL